MTSVDEKPAMKNVLVKIGFALFVVVLPFLFLFLVAVTYS